MRENHIVDGLPGLTAAELARLESKVGSLPKELRDLYSHTNGGVPQRRFFEDVSGFENEIDRILTAVHRQFEHEVLLEDYYEEITRTRKAVPERFVPFARNAGDDLYLMDRDTGAVAFWAHDVPGEELRPVASSLSEILSQAETEDEFYG